MSADDPLRRLDADRAVLVLVDYQQRLLPALDGGEAALADALALADLARALAVPVLGTEQNPDGLGPNHPALRERCARTLPKQHFDACEDGLGAAIADARPLPPGGGPADVVIAGCEAHVCLLQTALGLRRAGHAVWAVASACASRRAEDRALGLQRLQAAGVGLVAWEMVAFEWLQHARHPRFKAVLPLIKGRPA
ncbi:isochorismatase family protein [Piscinibacter sakaiensis]|uniref:Isochorismatase n=1 Tax=Piscinibacter sakaiensis TaxID=1547922 RepID=A0A0K8NXS5_PISS1|nr:isochorismatase family protein [Piscinibacter sakaiensis]GAP34730.1 isochorismatase [Piscinibacter sakaiensis]